MYVLAATFHIWHCGRETGRLGGKYYWELTARAHVCSLRGYSIGLRVSRTGFYMRRKRAVLRTVVDGVEGKDRPEAGAETAVRECTMFTYFLGPVPPF